MSVLLNKLICISEKIKKKILRLPRQLRRKRNTFYYLVSNVIRLHKSHTSDVSLEVTRRLKSENRYIYYYVAHAAVSDRNAGIQRVTRSLACALQELGVMLIPVKWSKKERKLIPANLDDKVNLSMWNGPDPGLWQKWMSFQGRRNNSSWLIVPELTGKSTEYVLDCARNSGLQCAWIFYDAIPWRLEKMYSTSKALVHKQYMLSLSCSDIVFAISDYSLNDLKSIYFSMGLDIKSIDKKLYSVPLPGEFLEAPRTLHAKEYHGLSVVKVLCVGSIERRKNQLKFLHAVLDVQSKSDIQIIVTLAGNVGGVVFDFELAEEVQALIDRIDGAVWVRGVSDEDLKHMYEECDFTVYPSVEEGFGLPILESLWHARPCVCADFGAMAEVADGGGCVTVNVKDVDAISSALIDLVEDKEALNNLSREAVLREYKTWKQYGCEIISKLYNC